MHACALRHGGTCAGAASVRRARSGTSPDGADGRKSAFFGSQSIGKTRLRPNGRDHPPRRSIGRALRTHSPAGNAVGNAQYRRAAQSAPPLRSIKNVYCWPNRDALGVTNPGWTVNIKTTGKNLLLRSLREGEEAERSALRLRALVVALGYEDNWPL